MSILGPIGGPGGSLEAPSLSGRVQSVTVNGGAWINGIQFVDDLGTVIQAGEMSSGTLLTFTVDEGDKIASVEVTFTTYVQSLAFHMASGKTHVAAGKRAGLHNGHLKIQEDNDVDGLYCRAGSYLDTFGLQTT